MIARCSSVLQQVREMLRSPRIHVNDKLRLVVLYALRYETKTREINEFKALLRHKFDSPSRVSVRRRAGRYWLVYTMLFCFCF